MNPDQPLLEKAERYIRSAALLAADGDIDSAASRLYYAMFYTAEALLATISQSFSSHQAVISAFGRHFAKTGKLPAQHHRALLKAFNRRQLGDYSATSGLTQEDVHEMRDEAEEFLADARLWLQKHQSDQS